MAKAKRIRAPKTRGSGTLTEAAFWSMIRSALRRKSMWWKPLQDVKKQARRDNQSENKRLKYEYQCVLCKNWFPEKLIEVDHIIPAGSLRSGDDLKTFVEKLFCESDGFRVLCEVCHAMVTKEHSDAKT